MSICDDLPELDILSLNSVELNNLGFVVGDSGKQGVITFQNLIPYLEKETIPIGFTMDFFGDTAPTGWLLLDGSTFSSVTYPELYSFLGSSTLPDYRGRSSEGATLRPNNVGVTQGIEEVVITEEQMASHTHSYTDTVGLNNPSSQGDNSSGKYEGDDRFKPTSSPIDTIKTTEVTGQSLPVSNRQPTIIVNKLIKAN